ncbi:MAG: T9SS type A sorting domain-containing protein [Saprospiraceae bacterium]
MQKTINPYCRTLQQWFLFSLMVMTLFPQSGFSQGFECGSPDPSLEQYSKMQSEVETVYQMSLSTSPQPTIEIPVYFTVVRNADGTIPNFGDLTAAYIDIRVDFLNNKVAGTGFHFNRLGAVNYIDHDVFAQGDFGGMIRENYSYVNTAFNVYLRPGTSGYGSQPGQNSPSSPQKDNTLTLGVDLFTDDGEVYSHETGHNFSLLHTFGAPQAYKYPDVLTDLNQIDHPYSQSGFPRELAIRDDVPMGTKNFIFTNKFTAGDLCWDTEADCTGSYGTRSTFPEFDPTNIANCIANPNSVNCLAGCLYPGCGYNGLYKDYNEDPIVGEPNNIMAVTYHSTCDVHFSDCQKNRMVLTFQDFWANKIDQGLLINVTDKVEYKGTTEPLKNVVLRWRHPSTPKYTNCVSDKDGDFRGVLYDQTVTAEVRKIGSTKEVGGFIPNPNGLGGTLYYIDAYAQDEWLEGLTTYDLVCISKHILGTEPLASGYDIIAADANRSSSITSFDIVEFRKLILGIYQKLPQQQSPWIFVPEYIPQDYQTQFDLNPFSIDIDVINQDVSYTEYSTATWQYNIPPPASGQRGYDGIKLGNVCGPMLLCEEPEITFLSPALIEPDQILEIEIKAIGFNNIESFQTGIFLDHEKLEVLDVLAGDLPEFSKEDNAGLTQLEHDQINIAWFKSNVQPHTLGSSGSEWGSLFKVRAKALQPITDISSVINLDKEKVAIPTGFFDVSGCVDDVQLQAVITPIFERGNERSLEKNQSSLTRFGNDTFFCFPNPAGDQVSIVFENHAEDQQGLFSFYDSQGRTIKSLNRPLHKGVNTITLGVEIQNLPEGIYNVLLVSKDHVKTGRFFKK